MLKLSQQLMAVQLESKSLKIAREQQEESAVQISTGNSRGCIMPSGPPSLLDSGSEQSSDSTEESPCLYRRTRMVNLHPPGFKVLISRINKFSGEKAADNFEVWLEDYLRQPETVSGAIRTEHSGFLGSLQGQLRQHGCIQ